MITKKEMNSIKNIARIAGILLLIMTVVGPFSIMYVPSQIIVSEDATATANNLMAFESLFRMGIVGHLVVLFADLGVAILLYILLKPVSKTLSLIAAVFRLIMVAIRGINLLNYFFALLLVSGDVYLTTFQTNQVHGFVLLFLNAFDYGLFIDLAFFGPHLLFIGYLVFKSGYFPKIMGVLLIIAGFGYLIDSFAIFLYPNYQANIAQFTFWGELLLTFWLLFKGVDVEQWKNHTLESN